MSYDLFISYSRKDNVNNRITELKTRIEAEYAAFAKEELKCFFDTNEIQGMDDWKHNLLKGLKDSDLILLILSPNYLNSPYCEWEIVEYLKYEYARATQGEGVAQIYFMEIPGFEDPGFEIKAKAWLEKISYRQRFDLRPWFNEGTDALKRADVKNRLDELKSSLYNRITRMRRIAKAPGNLPAPNTRFVGREREMKLLHESVGLGRFGVLTAVHGMGGLGKTAIAFQYAYAYADFYPGGRWLIRCANETDLAVVLKKLELDLKVIFTEDEKKDNIRGAKHILNRLEALAGRGSELIAESLNIIRPAVLLILDNVDHADLIQSPNIDLISGKEWLKVLVTTRMGPEALGSDETSQSWLTIDELPFEDAYSLIESYQPGGCFKDRNEQEKAGEIVKLLGCFTLAVEVAAIYLHERKGQVSCADFLELLKREGCLRGVEIAGLNTKARTSVDHNKLISVTLAPTLDLLSQAETLLLSYASLLPPDSIPVSWLRAMAIKEYPELGKDAEAGLDDPWLTTLNHILSLRLLQIASLEDNALTPRLVRMHRLLQSLVKQPNKIQTGSLIMHAWVRSEILNAQWHIGTSKWEIAPLVTFVENISDKEIPGIHRILASLCLWLPDADSSDTPLRLMRKCRSLIDYDETGEVSERITMLSSLGLILRQRGNYEEAEDVLREGINLFNIKQIKDDLAFATLLNNLAKVLLHNEKASEALPFARLAISKVELFKGRNDATFASFMNNLGEILISLNKTQEAIYYIEKAYEIRKNHFGESHSYIAVSLSSYAKYYFKNQQYDEALKYIEAAIPMYRSYYGDKHLRLAEALQIRAGILEATFHFQQAVSSLNDALVIRKELLPIEHPDIQNTLKCLENIMHKLSY